MTNSLKVAVIGAGLAGLSVARELKRESHEVVMFEKSSQLGGTWVYDSRIESDLLGIDPNREIVHTSIYKSLRTNGPRHLMSFTDFKFNERVYHDPRMYPGHEEVLEFVKDFANHFKLVPLIRFNTMVTRVELVDSDVIEFAVESNTNGVSSVEVFDAVVVCNGHYTHPQLATDIPGIDKWSRQQMHSHNYRVPEPFRDLVVVVIGSGPSAIDISKDIATVAKEVHMSSRSSLVKVGKSEKFNNMWQHSKISSVSEDGLVTFENDFSIYADMILHCTGFKIQAPFLETKGIVNVADKSIRPLYKHVFPPQLAPRLSFIGIPDMTLPFMLMDCQSKWVAYALSMKAPLPSKEEMMSVVEKHYEELKQKGLSDEHTHRLGFQIDYIEWVWAQCGMVLEKNIKEMVEYLIICFQTVGLDGYRDMFFAKYGKQKTIDVYPNGTLVTSQMGGSDVGVKALG